MCPLQYFEGIPVSARQCATNIIEAPAEKLHSKLRLDETLEFE